MANNLSYVDYDFDNLREQLRERVREADAWKDAYRSGTGEMLIDFYAYIANLVLYYVERRAEESYIETAKNRSSVVNLVKLVNYSPKRRTSSTGIVTFSLTTAHTSDIFIEKFTRLSETSGLKFFVGEKELDSDGNYTGNIVGGGVLKAGSTSITLRAIQGDIVGKTITSNGSVDQTYLIEETTVEEYTLSVVVDGVIWESVSSFAASEPEDTHYVVRQELDGTIKILFGDNQKGYVPPLGSTIYIQYVLSDGEDGNVLQGDRITTIEDDVSDINGNIITLSVTNSSEIDPETGDTEGAFVGGDAEEDIEEIRYEAPRVFRTGDRAVTRNDFIAILENYAGIATANAWGENEEDPPNYTMFNRVKLCFMMTGWALPTTTFKSLISEYLYTKSMITVKYEFITPEVIYVVPTLDVIVTKNYSLSQATLDIENAFEAEFVLGSTTRLGTDKNYSNLVRLIDDLDGVSYHHLTLEIYQEIDTDISSSNIIGSAGSFSGTLNLAPIKEGTVKVYVGAGDTAVQTAVDNESGAFVTVGDYAVAGTIDYSTGAYSVDLSPTPPVGTVVAIRYQQAYENRDNDIVVGYNQICKLQDVDITDISSEN
jgi:hypothetical protein